MTRHSGTLRRPHLPDTNVVIRVADGRSTIVAEPGRWLGAWPLEEVRFERHSPLEFGFWVRSEEWTFVADDPASFAEAVGVVVDLRPSSTRFGLADRLRQAREEERTGG